MAYNINGICLDRAEAIAYMCRIAAQALGCTPGEIRETVADYIHSLIPGTRREYAQMRIACVRVID